MGLGEWGRPVDRSSTMPLKQAVPIVMLHGVAPDGPDRPPQMDHWLDPTLFERYLTALRRDGFHFVFLDEVARFKRGEIDLPKRSVGLTFDDGYLDFWLYVFPLLQRYGAKATVFVNTDFVDGEQEPRRLGQDFPWGFLSWPEMRAMTASGLVSVQSHARTHTWYFVGPKLLDVHRPDLPWKLLRFLWWNRYPSRKPAWYREGSHRDLPWGLPVLEHAMSLLARAYHLPPTVEEELISRVEAEGGASFFADPGWNARYSGWYHELLESAGPGRYETEDERRERLREELEGSRLEISNRLGRETRFLLCPGGSLSWEVIDLAKECGYFAVTIPSTVWPIKERNRRGGDSTLLYRISSTTSSRRSDALRAALFRVRVNAEAGILRHRVAGMAVRGLGRAGLI